MERVAPASRMLDIWSLSLESHYRDFRWKLKINEEFFELNVQSDMPLLWVWRDKLKLMSFVSASLRKIKE